jgi:hypothetical protein
MAKARCSPYVLATEREACTQRAPPLGSTRARVFWTHIRNTLFSFSFLKLIIFFLSINKFYQDIFVITEIFRLVMNRIPIALSTTCTVYVLSITGHYEQKCRYFYVSGLLLRQGVGWNTFIAIPVTPPPTITFSDTVTDFCFQVSKRI